MKISPIAGPSQGSVDVGQGQTSEARKDAAKAAYLGKTQHQVTPIEEEKPSLAEAAKVKRIQMRTNVSPDRSIEQELAQEPAEESAQLNSIEGNDLEVIKPISPQLAALAKQRRALQLEKQEFERLKKSQAEQQVPPGNVVDIAEIQSNPLEALKKANVSYEQLTEAILAEQSGVTPEVRALQAKIDALEKDIDSKLSERDQQAEKQVLTEMRREADRLVSTGDEFEMVRETRSQNKIIELIHRTWKTSGEVLDVHEAAQLVEDQLVEDSLKMASYGKVRKQLAPEQSQAQSQQQVRNTGIKTLTNRDTAVRPASSRDRAIAAFFGTLKR